ncbi:MAG: hypothetical protein IJ642_07420 [Oscillospiraceae bacterium]|nr:hypothetical protein [Oscillospiraceae bacterium]
MKLLIQSVLYCLLFTGMVKYSVQGGALDGLYFYPKSVQERAIEIGLTTREFKVKVVVLSKSTAEISAVQKFYKARNNL